MHVYSLVEEILLHVGRDRVKCPVISEGVVTVGDKEVHVKSVLFDSGGLCESLISKKLVDANREQWLPYITTINAAVKMGDGRTAKKVTEQIIINLGVIDFELVEHSATFKALVWDMDDLDMIAGLYDIIDKFGDLFLQFINKAIETHVRQPEASLNAIQGESITKIESTLQAGEMLRWSNGDDDGAPENDECPDPCAFTSVLLFMETSHEEAMATYLSQFEKQVEPSFLAYPGVRELLLSDLAKNRFVPKEWKGLLGFPPLKLAFKDTLPAQHPVRSRPINSRLFEHSRKEFDRLMQYLYVPSRSPWASPLVIAPKATAPFIRFCGDYVWLNEHVIFPQLTIPSVGHEIVRASKCAMFLDADLCNSFHQIPLDEETSQKLAVQTPWGLVEPKFLPEGVSPASGFLQYFVTQMFSDYAEWMICIFDNILILADDHEDLLRKFKLFLERFELHNVILKFTKTWIGFITVKFFGYEIEPGSMD